MTRARLLGISLTLAFFGACVEPSTPGPAAVPEKTASRKDVFLFLGDSLTAGYGIAKDEAYPALLAKRWKRENIPFRVRNAGVSGSTAKGVLENLAWNVTEDVHTVFLAIGANDGLRGHDLDATRLTLDEVVLGIRARGARVVLAGIMIPPNYGPAYTQRFKQMYPDVAKKHGLKLMPFLLDGVAANPALNIADGIHPNAKGHRVMAENVHSFLSREGVLP